MDSSVSSAATNVSRSEVRRLAQYEHFQELADGESMLLMVLGIVLGAIFAYGVVYVVRGLYPAFPLMPPWWAVPSAALTALSAGLLFSWLPARRASNLDPVLAMRGIAE